MVILPKICDKLALMENDGQFEAFSDHSWEDLQYSHSVLNIIDRKRVYDLAEHPKNIYSETYDAMGLTGNERILDAGFGDAQFLIDLKEYHGHSGEIIGIDNPGLVDWAEELLNYQPIEGVKVQPGDVMNLDFADNSFDVVTSFFVLYHTEPEAALNEIKRVLVPNGKLAVSTSGDFNKYRQRIFEGKVAEELGIKPPRLFNTVFSTANAKKYLYKYFDNVNRITQFDQLAIRDDTKDIYLRSLISMRTAFEPIPEASDFLDAISAIVIPKIDGEIKSRGKFTDWIDRAVFICG